MCCITKKISVCHFLLLWHLTNCMREAPQLSLVDALHSQVGEEWCGGLGGLWQLQELVANQKVSRAVESLHLLLAPAVNRGHYKISIKTWMECELTTVNTTTTLTKYRYLDYCHTLLNLET